MSVGENGFTPGHVTEAPIGPGHSGSGTTTPPHPLVAIFSISEVSCSVAVPLAVVFTVVSCVYSDFPGFHGACKPLEHMSFSRESDHVYNECKVVYKRV
jgi:hypothetical protein